MEVGTVKREEQRGSKDENEFVPHFKFWPDQPPNRGAPLLLQIFSFLRKKPIGS